MRKWVVASVAAAVIVLLVPAIILAVWVGYSIYGEVQYSGSQTGKIMPCAIPEGADEPIEDGCDLIDGPGPFEIDGLPPGKYSVCAFLDLEGDENGPPQPDEPFGCSDLLDLTEGDVRGVVVVLQDPQAEFVPEPGTVLLLGSGLAGLAGYASLRWRNRK